MKYLGAGMAVLLTLSPVAGNGHEASADYSTRTISITGFAEVEVPPDFIVVTAGVTLRGDSPAALQSAVRSAVAEMLSFIRSLDVDDADVSTDHISLGEVDLDYDDDDCPSLSEGPKFEADTRVKVSLRRFDLYDDLVAGLFRHGANRLVSVTFDSTRRAEKTREARVAAVQAAREKATYMAAELGQRLGDPLEVTEGSSTPISRSYTSNTYIVDGMNSTDLNLPSISASRITVSAQVSILFALQSP